MYLMSQLLGSARVLLSGGFYSSISIIALIPYSRHAGTILREDLRALELSTESDS